MENTKDFILENKEVGKIEVSEAVENVGLKDVKGGIKSLEMHKTNPFIKDTIVHVDKGYKKIKVGTNEALVSVTTGELFESQMHYHKVEVDRATFVRIFTDQIHKIYDLPSPARKLFEYIASNLKPNTDEIYLHYEELATLCNYKSTNQVYKALIVLHKKGILSRSYRPYWWFINPTILYNGNRLLLIKDYVLKTQDEDKIWNKGLKDYINDNDGED